MMMILPPAMVGVASPTTDKDLVNMKEVNKQSKDPENCEHEYTEPYDAFNRCCHCEKLIGAIQPEIPSYWFLTHSDIQPRVNGVRTAREVLNGDFPEDCDSRYIHICGACGHWLHAVHDTWFNHFDSEIADTAFGDMLMETLCPDCGAALFRDGSVVAPLASARKLTSEHVKNHVLAVANHKFWSGWTEDSYVHNPGGDDEFVDITVDVLEHPLYDHTNRSRGYKARCPACARPASESQVAFDFHHWDYDDDIGCRLCRECHSHIHRDKTAEEQSKTTGKAWEYDAVERLVELSQKLLHFENEQQFIRRFNIPRESTAFDAVQETFSSN
jgi:hypothetical protein